MGRFRNAIKEDNLDAVKSIIKEKGLAYTFHFKNSRTVIKIKKVMYVKLSIQYGKDQDFMHYLYPIYYATWYKSANVLKYFVDKGFYPPNIIQDCFIIACINKDFISADILSEEIDDLDNILLPKAARSWLDVFLEIKN